MNEFGQNERDIYPIRPPWQAKPLRFIDNQPHYARKLQNRIIKRITKCIRANLSAKSSKNIISNIYALTKYDVGANANPPKKARRPPKNGIIIAMNIVKAVLTLYKKKIK